MTKGNNGFLYLLERSAELLERAAEEIKISHTVGGRWPRNEWPRSDEFGAKRDFDELREIAKGLRKAHKYHKPNCLGGPAKMFDAIADRIRAGEKMKSAMSDYDLRFKRSNDLGNRRDAFGASVLTDGLAGNG